MLHYGNCRIMHFLELDSSSGYLDLCCIDLSHNCGFSHYNTPSSAELWRLKKFCINSFWSRRSAFLQKVDGGFPDEIFKKKKRQNKLRSFKRVLYLYNALQSALQFTASQTQETQNHNMLTFKKMEKPNKPSLNYIVSMYPCRSYTQMFIEVMTYI